LLDLQPKAVTVAVKHLAGKTSTLSLSDAEAKQQIQQAAQTAVAHVADYAPWKIAGPVEMTMEYLPQPPQQLELARLGRGPRTLRPLRRSSS